MHFICHDQNMDLKSIKKKPKIKQKNCTNLEKKNKNSIQFKPLVY